MQRYEYQVQQLRENMIGGKLSADKLEALLLFLWVDSGALRRVRGRSSQVKGACGVAAARRCAPP